MSYSSNPTINRRITVRPDGLAYIATTGVNNFSISIPTWARTAKRLEARCKFIFPGVGGERVVMIPEIAVGSRADYPSIYQGYDGGAAATVTEGGALVALTAAGQTKAFCNFTLHLESGWEWFLEGRAHCKAGASGGARGGGSFSASHTGTWSQITKLEFHTLISGTMSTGTSVELTAVF